MKRLLVYGLVTLAVGTFPIGATAQSTYATVSGSVIDQQRSILPDVAITVTSLDTGEVRSATSDGRGAFRIIGLSPGRYELRAIRAPFAEVLQADLTLGLSD